MPLYQMKNERFDRVRKTSFEAEGKREREDLQRLLRNQPEVLEEGLLIIGEEFGDWAETNRRIDLLALDEAGRLVVIELKRSDLGDLIESQAIRYAALVANMTLEQAIAGYSEYLKKQGKTDDPDAVVRQHCSKEDGEARIDSSSPRIILVSSSFSKELTTSVLWLNETGLDIKCVRLDPYNWQGYLLVESSQVIPVPEADDYIVRLRNREQEVKQQESAPVQFEPSSKAFRDALKTVDSTQKEFAESLYQWALSLEKSGLATLTTNVGPTNTVLHVRLFGRNRGLINIFRNKQGWCYGKFSGNAFRNLAPKTKERVEELRGEAIGPHSTLWETPDGLLDALTDAYREAQPMLVNPQPYSPEGPDNLPTGS